jgi:invasion protein IalB
VRITSTFWRLAAAGLLGLTLAAASVGAAAAQNNPPAAGQFGPRVKPGQQQQQGAQAAPGKAAGPSAEVVATHGAWKIQCEVGQKAGAAEGPKEGERQCGMVQGTKSEKNPKATLTLIIIKTKQGDKPVNMMRVVVPIGVFLPTGVALEIDGAAVGRVPFTRCMPQVCMAFAEASPDTLAKLKKGNEANFIIYEAPGLGLPMKLNLDGFSAALAELDKL